MRYKRNLINIETIPLIRNDPTGIFRTKFNAFNLKNSSFIESCETGYSSVIYNCGYSFKYNGNRWLIKIFER